MSIDYPYNTMEDWISSWIDNRKTNIDETRPNTCFFPTLIDCCEEAKSVVFAYDVQPWMANSAKMVHGGIVATLLDTTMGILSISQTEDHRTHTPTISMTVNYLRSVPMDTTVFIKASVVCMDNMCVHTKGELYLSKEPERVLATATGVYLKK